MLYLLSPRVWIELALVALLAFTHATAYRKGKANVMSDWNAAKAEATIEARRVETERQAAVDAAERASAQREARLRSDAAGARTELGRLRNAVSATRGTASQPSPAETDRANRLGELLIESAEAYQELAGRCDRHVNDLRTLLESWPK